MRTPLNEEACIAMMNNIYSDGVHWHDVACHHEKHFVCEDADVLITYARDREPNREY